MVCEHEPGSVLSFIRLAKLSNSTNLSRMAIAEKEESQDGFYFEGVEKLVEIWFKGDTGQFDNCDLRKIPRDEFEKMLKIVKCEVVSFSSNDKVDAYVLSESSMFVSERRFILKTCGTTTPLECLPYLLEIVPKYSGFTCVEDIFYSRKNFKRPELQYHPHKTFDDEVKYLDTFFQNGMGLRLGDKEADCWYLYTLNGGASLSTNLNNNETSPIINNPCLNQDPDQTLEILMTDLDPQVMKIFTKEVSSSALQATQKSGIDTILPDMKIDDYLFDPCGYSMNGISKDGSYMTIHITPEPEFSYASFETNLVESSVQDVIERVINIFNPGKFVLTVFSNKDSLVHQFPKDLTLKEELRKVNGLECREVKCCQLRSYDLGFAFYSKFPS